MTATSSSCPSLCLAAAGFEPGGGDECGHFTCLHPWQAGQDILEVVPRRNAKAVTLTVLGADGKLR